MQPQNHAMVETILAIMHKTEATTLEIIHKSFSLCQSQHQ